METKFILKEERKKRGFTQEDVAKYLNIERGSYAKYETGANTPTTDNIVKLADLYSLSTDYLLGRTDTNERFKPLPKNLKEMFEGLKQVNEEFSSSEDITSPTLQGVKKQLNEELAKTRMKRMIRKKEKENKE